MVFCASSRKMVRFVENLSADNLLRQGLPGYPHVEYNLQINSLVLHNEPSFVGHKLWLIIESCDENYSGNRCSDESLFGS